MPKAVLTRASGLTITVEGTAAEIHDLVRRLEAPIDAPTLSRTPVSRKTASGSGPRAWLEELAADGFFDTPKGQRQILDKMAEAGHHLKDSDITQQLQRLTRDKILRRQKVPLGGGERRVWGYSKW